MNDADDIVLPEELNYTCTLEPGHQTTACQFCRQEAQCYRFILGFPDDQDFLDWEAGRKNRGMRGPKPPLKAYTPAKLESGETVDGWFCSELCAKKSYFPIYVVWRLGGGK